MTFYKKHFFENLTYLNESKTLLLIYSIFSCLLNMNNNDTSVKKSIVVIYIGLGIIYNAEKCQQINKYENVDKSLYTFYDFLS